MNDEAARQGRTENNRSSAANSSASGGAAGLRLWPEEAERGTLSAILGAGCIDADAGLRTLRKALSAGLDPAHFGGASYAMIFAAMVRLADDGLPVDAISVAAELDRDHSDARAVSRLRVLVAEIAPLTAIERYASIVVDAAVRREIEERAC